MNCPKCNTKLRHWQRKKTHERSCPNPKCDYYIWYKEDKHK